MHMHSSKMPTSNPPANDRDKTENRGGQLMHVAKGWGNLTSPHDVSHEPRATKGTAWLLWPTLKRLSRRRRIDLLGLLVGSSAAKFFPNGVVQ